MKKIYVLFACLFSFDLTQLCDWMDSAIQPRHCLDKGVFWTDVSPLCIKLVCIRSSGGLLHNRRSCCNHIKVHPHSYHHMLSLFYLVFFFFTGDGTEKGTKQSSPIGHLLSQPFFSSLPLGDLKAWRSTGSSSSPKEC